LTQVSEDGVVEAFASGSGATASEKDDLAAGLAGLAQLPSGRMALEQLLTRVAQYAVQAIPGAEGVGLALLEEGRLNPVVTSVDFVLELDAVQYGLREGPCITAVQEGVTVVSGALVDDPRWLGFGERVARLGVHSALALPLRAADAVVGVLNVYAHAPEAFDEDAAALGEVFATPAAVAVQNAQVLEQARRLTGQLQAALESRRLVERAVGVLMSRSGESADEATERLRALAQHDQVKLVALARTILDEAVRRARSRPLD
jgi:GAF domain-containing protein